MGSSSVISRPLLGFCLVAAIASSGCHRVKTRSVLDVAELKAYASGENEEGDFDIRGTVTFADAASDDVVLQDATGGIRIALPESVGVAEVGSSVRMQGTYDKLEGQTFFQASNLTITGHGELPKPVPIGSESFKDDAALLYRRVSISGVVQSARLERPGLASLTLRSGARRITLKVVTVGAYDLDRLVDATLRATGVLALHPGAGGGTVELLDPDSRDLSVIQAPVPQGQIPTSAINEVGTNPADSFYNHRVRVRGTISSAVGADAAIADRTGRIVAHFLEKPAHPTDSIVDVLGFRAREGGQTVLEAATMLPTSSGSESCSNRRSCSQLFRTARAVHALQPDEARMRMPVRLNAVVTYSDTAMNRLFVQDTTDGIYVQVAPGGKTAASAGDRVQVEGVTTPGDFAPIVAGGRVHRMGETAMPAPVTDLEAIFAGREDSRWIQLSGVVQDVRPERSDVIASLVWGTYAFKAHVHAPLDRMKELIDRRVTVQAACGALFNARRQVMGIQLFVPGMEFVKPQREVSTGDNTTPYRSVAHLLRFSPDLDLSHRILIEGTVTLASRSGPTWISDANGDGIKIESHEPVDIQEGDFVSAAGFPAASGYNALLRSGIVHHLHSGDPVKPVWTTVDEAARGAADSQLIQVRGTLIDESVRDGLRTLTLQSGRTIFQAQLPLGRKGKALRSGAVLLVTGICSAIVSSADGVLVPKGFRLNLRSAADLSVIKDAPWLTFTRLMQIFSVTGLLGFAALVWAALLRKHVRAQTAQLTEKSRLIQSAYERSNFQATHDALTGLPNRLSFTTALETGLYQARAGGQSLGLMFIDLNGFKQVNDNLGHLTGDELLKCVAQRLQSRLTQREMLARVGGDEFAIVIHDVKTPQELMQIGQRVTRTLEERFVVCGYELFIGASVGISTFPDCALDATELQKTADLAMYSMKNQPIKNGCAYFTPEMHLAHSGRVAMERDLRAAVDRSELTIYYQPKVLFNGALAGFEALVRWNHPVLGLLAPGHFIPVAEQTGLINPIGVWVLRESCRFGAQLQERFHRNLRIAVNVSAVQLNREDFVATVHDALAVSGLSPELLELELTESLLVTDIAGATNKMLRLRECGVTFALDDFGQGHWSFTGLRQLPLNVLKIDRSLIADLEASRKTRSIIESIIKMAHELELTVTAEGVESVRQSRILQSLGCDLGQGYLFGKPLPCGRTMEAVEQHWACDSRAPEPSFEQEGSSLIALLQRIT